MHIGEILTVINDIPIEKYLKGEDGVKVHFLEDVSHGRTEKRAYVVREELLVCFVCHFSSDVFIGAGLPL